MTPPAPQMAPHARFLQAPLLARALAVLCVLGGGVTAHAARLSPDLPGPPEPDRTVEASPPADPVTARALFQRACEQGDGEACVRHALTTLRGEGVERDAAEGQRELRDACERYPESACGRAIGGLAEQGASEGGEPEWELMALFAQRGCEAGEGLSCRLLGDAFYAGRGVSLDVAKAFELYGRACDTGEGTACAAQGVLLQSAGDRARATGLFTRGCELGSSEACRGLVLATLDPREGVTDETVRRERFWQACERGAGVGCLALYDALRAEPPEAGTSLRLSGLLKRACRLGETQACQFLDEISRLAEPRCAEGSASACGVLGVLLVSPPALPEETESGLWLLHQSCRAGDAASCALLEARR